MNTHDLAGFLALHPPGTGELTVHTPENTSFTFTGLDLDLISAVCPLLAFSFEEATKGRRLHSLAAASVELVSRFLRFLYTRDYRVVDHQGQELPCSLLMHAQLYHYGELYDVRRLVDAAYISISEISELSCSMPSPPVGLCDTLRYLYLNVKDCLDAHHTLLHYCISCFNYHRLSENEEFRKLLMEVQACGQDLCKLNMQRGFEDESSAHIIRMQMSSPPRRQTYSYDHLCDMFGGSSFSTPMHTPLLTPESASPVPGFTLIHRPRGSSGRFDARDSDGYSSDGSHISDIEEFSLVGRPRLEHGSSLDLFETRNDLDVYNTELENRLSRLHRFSEPEARMQDSRTKAQSNNPFMLGEWVAASRNAPNQFNFNDSRLDSLSPIRRPVLDHSGLSSPSSNVPGQSITTSNDSDEDLDPFRDPSDADESDSEWSVVSDHTSPHNATALPIRSRSMYNHDAFAGSAETIVAVSEREESVTGDAMSATDAESSDSEWSVVSEGTGVEATP